MADTKPPVPWRDRLDAAIMPAADLNASSSTMIRSIFRALPTSMGGILNAVAAVYFLQKGGAWIWLGLAHIGMVVLLGVISAKKAKLAQAEQGARSDATSGATGSSIVDTGKENR